MAQLTVAIHGGDISIHVPRVGDDRSAVWCRPRCQYFYPRPPRGGRPRSSSVSPVSPAFLSTSPAWGTTLCGDGACETVSHFYPRPPRGGRAKASAARSGCHCISIHVPRVGDDPRPSRKRRGRAYISIHVPRVGDDRAMGRYQCPDRHFYPRPPRGGRLWTTAHTRKRLNFYPRPPRGGRQKLASPTLTPAKFLSTSPAWGTTQGPV